MVVFLDDWINRSPWQQNWFAVMIMVSNWYLFLGPRLRDLKKNPKSSSIVMIATVVVVVIYPQFSPWVSWFGVFN